MRLKNAVLLSFYLTVCSVYSQSSETGRLLNQAEAIVSFDPIEANTIAEHTLKNATNNTAKIRSLYVSALSAYVLGDYDKSLPKVFEARELAAYSNNEEYEQKSGELIYRIFNFLQLNNQKDEVYSASEIPIFKTEDFIRKGNELLEKNHLDSAHYYAGLVENENKDDELGYRGALYHGLMGDIYFAQKDFKSSLLHYKEAIAVLNEIRNPFLGKQLYDKIAANYLVLDSLQKFQENSETAKSYNILLTEIENRASNEVHKLKINELDQEYKHQTAFYRNLTWILFGLALSAVLIKIIFYIRNRNRLKMYRRLMNYLKLQEEQRKVEVQEVKAEPKVSIEDPAVEDFADTKTTPVGVNPRSSSLLKESEEQILNSLEKFESSGRFNHKDMSLSKLAAQLNTNTKYLSEAINRHKGMNFNAYINKLRIDYIIGKMKEDPTYLNYKVSYLAEECGYSSHSTFTTVFKSIVGVSPITFVEFIKEESNQEEITT